MARLKTTIVDDLIETVMERVNNYTYVSGEPIPELSLAEEFGVSRTPVREAIAKLIDYSVLEKSKSKVIVKAITTDDIVELLQVREAVECMAMEIIIRNGGLTKEQKDTLHIINNKLSEYIKLGSFEDNFNQDALFHETLVEYSGNLRLKEIFQRVHIQSCRLRWLTMLTPVRYTSTFQEHEDILNYLSAQDTDKLRSAIKNHIARSQDNYLEIISGVKWVRLMNEIQSMNKGKTPGS